MNSRQSVVLTFAMLTASLLVVVTVLFIVSSNRQLLAGGLANSEDQEGFQGPKSFVTLGIKEPSGICFHRQRESLFVVGDEGDIVEMSLQGKVLNRRKYTANDFEGITHVPETGLLYVAMESNDSIIEFNPDTLEKIRIFKLSRKHKGQKLLKAGGDGIEGISFVPNPENKHGGTFFVANQSFSLKSKKEVSAILEVELPLKKYKKNKKNSRDKKNKKDKHQTFKAKIVRFFEPGVVDLSGLYYDYKNNLLYVISDSENRVLSYDLRFNLQQSKPLDGKSQEGITMVSGAVAPVNFLFIAQDDGRVYRYEQR